MRRILLAVCCSIIPLAWAGSARAEEPADAKHEPPKFKAVLHDEKGREKEEAFDFSNPVTKSG